MYILEFKALATKKKVEKKKKNTIHAHKISKNPYLQTINPPINPLG